MKELSIENQIYLCKYHDIVTDSDLRTTMGIARKQADELVKKYKANGLYEQYRNLQEEQYEAIIKNRMEAPKSNTDRILEKYEFDITKPGYDCLKQLIEYLNVNKKKSIVDAYQEVANNYKDKDEISVRNAIYRLVSEKKITLTQILKNETEWVGPDKKRICSNKRRKCRNGYKLGVYTTKW